MIEETLEEAAERIYPNEGYKDEAYCDLGEMSRELWLEGAKWQQEQEKITTDDAYNEGFENGKRWQQERSYSEEDLISLLEFNYKKETNQLGTLRKDYSQKIVREWFEQFKK